MLHPRSHLQERAKRRPPAARSTANGLASTTITAGTSRSSPPGGSPSGPSPPAPGREHDFTDDEHIVLADLGYEGKNDKLVCAIKAPSDGSSLSEQNRTANEIHNAAQACGERGNALL